MHLLGITANVIYRMTTPHGMNHAQPLPNVVLAGQFVELLHHTFFQGAEEIVYFFIFLRIVFQRGGRLFLQLQQVSPGLVAIRREVWMMDKIMDVFQHMQQMKLCVHEIR